RGNVAIAAEFNFYTDSEAAQIVLNDFQCPVYVNSWELTLHHPLDWEWYKQWQETKTQKGEFMKSICECGMKYYMSERGKDETLNQGWVACDPVAMAVAIDKKIITEMQELHATVELNGTYSRGQMIVDWCNHLPGRRKSFIVTKINVEILKELMKKSIE
ncbi:nucleoside hydrolase-like, partial [Saccoglossus kowalevskii]|uniref:Inosine-uridine preferring nucleoside hydrolase-like n=1 Tax=Saccoglossus kowalevskii TaxID=10224 RepID=A0ABM0LUH8_SACKO